MRIYLVRHAEAVPESYELTDEARWLTARRRATVAGVGAALAGRGIAFDAVVTSPRSTPSELCEQPIFASFRKGEVALIEEGRLAWRLEPDR